MTSCSDPLDMLCYWSENNIVACILYIASLLSVSTLIQVLWGFSHSNRHMLHKQPCWLKLLNYTLIDSRYFASKTLQFEFPLMAPSNTSDTPPPIEEFFQEVETFVERYKLDKRTKNLLRLSMPAHQAWRLLRVCIKERMAKARSASGTILSEIQKNGFRSDVNSRRRLIDVLQNNKGNMSRDDKRVIEDASLMQIMNLLDDVTARYKLDDRAFAILKEKTVLDKTMQLLISVISNGVLDRSKNPSSAIMGQLKMMPSQSQPVEDISPRRPVRRVSRSRSPANNRRSRESFPTQPDRIDREDRFYSNNNRNDRLRSPVKELVQRPSPHIESSTARQAIPIQQKPQPAVLSIEAALVTVNGWAEHNRISSRIRHDLLHRIPYDAVLRGISAYPSDASLGEALIRSLEKDPSCQEMPSIESLSREAEDYVTAIGAANSDILASIKQNLFIRDADSLVAGQLPSLHQNSLLTTVPILHDRIWFVQASLAALKSGQPLPAMRSIPQYGPAAPIYPPVAPYPTAPADYSGAPKYLGGIIIGAPMKESSRHQTSYRR